MKARYIKSSKLAWTTRDPIKMKEEGKGREGKEKLGWIDKVLHSGNSKVVFVRVRVCACTCVDVCESMLSVSVPGVYVEVRRDPLKCQLSRSPLLC